MTPTSPCPEPPPPPQISLKFGGGLHTSPMCVSPLLCYHIPNTWGNIGEATSSNPLSKFFIHYFLEANLVDIKHVHLVPT